uniref:Uncharacterized protein n=1 Tax=Anguilla anguilla TaxID=7936 RepID=A0A0E9Q4L1_ANGAN
MLQTKVIFLVEFGVENNNSNVEEVVVLLKRMAAPLSSVIATEHGMSLGGLAILT